MPKPPTATESTEIVADPANDKRERRRRSAQEKLRILAEADRCEGRGAISALLRREGIYSSHLTTWRKQLRSGGTAALEAKAPGRKPTRDERDRMIEKLEREKAQLAKKGAARPARGALARGASARGHRTEPGVDVAY